MRDIIYRIYFFVEKLEGYYVSQIPTNTVKKEIPKLAKLFSKRSKTFFP
jgi:hypothetical protein